MADTAQTLAGLLRQPVAGAVHLDSNAQEGHSFLDIVRALRATFGRDHWRVQRHNDYVHDQRLTDVVPRLPALSHRLVLPLPEASA